MFGLDRVGGADHLAGRLDRARALHHRRDQRAAGDERDQLSEERLLGVLVVVLVGDLLVGRASASARPASAPCARSGRAPRRSARRSKASGLTRIRVRSESAQRSLRPREAAAGAAGRALLAARLARARGPGRGERCSRRVARSRSAIQRRPSGSRIAPRAQLPAGALVVSRCAAPERCGPRSRRPVAGARGRCVSRSARRLRTSVSQNGTDAPLRVERLAALAAGVAQAPLAVRTAQVVGLDRVLAVRAATARSAGEAGSRQRGARARAPRGPRGTPAGARSCRRPCR